MPGKQNRDTDVHPDQARRDSPDPHPEQDGEANPHHDDPPVHE